MTTRLTTKIVNFLRPFTLNEVDGERPPGAYVVETEEEKRNFVLFSTYRRVSTVMSRSDLHAAGSLIRFLTIDPVELESALARESKFAAHYE